MLQLSPLLQTVITFGTLALLAGVAYSQFIKGRRNGSVDQIAFYKQEAANYKDMMEKKDVAHAAEMKQAMTDANNKYNELSREFGVLQGQFNAEKAAREKSEEILKDRNPETTVFMETMLKAAKDHDESHIRILGLLNDISKMVKSDLKIESTVTKQ